MKNQTTKFNKSKLVARGMLVVFLLNSVLAMVACGSSSEFSKMYASNQEFVDFIEKFNSQNDGSVSTFVSFDFDNDVFVMDKVYQIHLIEQRYFFDKGYRIFDKYQSGMTVKMAFHFDNLDKNTNAVGCAYQVLCSYGQVDFAFDENADISLMYVDNSNKNTVYNIDANFICCENVSYLYTNTFYLCVENKEIMTISVCSINEINKEKLDEICALLMDNLVIINTEG